MRPLHDALPISLLMVLRTIAIGNAGILSAVVVGANIIGNLVSGILIGRGAKRSALIAVSSAVMGAMGLGIFMSAMPVLLVLLLCVVFSGVAGLLPAPVLEIGRAHV